MSILSTIDIKLHKLKTYWQTSYSVEGYNIRIPRKHQLSLFQKQYPLYDKFLPILVQHLPPTGKIADVGANIGDTLFSTLFKCKNDFICIEGSDFFFEYLLSNVALLPDAEKKRIVNYKALAGTGKISGELSHVSSRTAAIVTSNSASPTHTPFDELVKNDGAIALIKSDTDGYDWDVLLSTEKTLAQYKPVLFWENEVRDDTQAAGMVRLYEMLKSKGYAQVCVFDNFGNLMLEHVPIDTLLSLNQYLLSMNKGQSERTIFYVDVLAVTDDKKHIADNAVVAFKKESGLH
jgi:FkbM family methyltransferase